MAAKPRKATRKASTSRKTSVRVSKAKKATARKKSTAKKRSTAAKKKTVAARKTAKKATARKSTAKKSTARKSTARKSTARKSTARKSTARKSTARKSTARKSAVRTSKSKSSNYKRPMRKTSQQTMEDVQILQLIAMDLSSSALAMSTGLMESARSAQKEMTKAQQNKQQQVSLSLCNTPVKMFSGKIRLEEGLDEMKLALNAVASLVTSMKKNKSWKKKASSKFSSGLRSLSSTLPKVVKLVNDNFEGPVQKAFVQTANSMTTKAKDLVKKLK